MIAAPRPFSSRVFHSWLFIYRDEESPLWIVDCLEFGVITHDASLSEAVAMGQEALELVIADDLESGLDPFGRQRAPNGRASEETWQKFYALLTASPQLLSGIPANDDIGHVALAALVPLFIGPKEERPPLPPPILAIPSHGHNA